MKRSRALTSLTKPLLLWTDLPLKTGEMMLAGATALTSLAEIGTSAKR